MYIGLHVKYPLFLRDFNQNRIFWTYFLKILSLMKICLVGAEMVYSDGRTVIETDRHTQKRKAIVYIRNFVKAPNTNKAVIQIRLLF